MANDSAYDNLFLNEGVWVQTTHTNSQITSQTAWNLENIQIGEETEKNFFEKSYASDYGRLKLSGNRVIVRYENDHNETDLILFEWTSEIGRLKNCSLSASRNMEVINGKTWLLIGKEHNEKTLINWVCAEELALFEKSPQRFENVTGIIKLKNKEITSTGSEVAYYLTDQWLPKSFFNKFLDLWEDFNDLMENWFPKITGNSLIRLFVETWEYDKRLFISRIDSNGQDYEAGDLEKVVNIDFFGEQIMLIKHWDGKVLYSMRLWKVLFQLVEDFEVETRWWEHASMTITAKLEWERMGTIVLWNKTSWYWEINQ